MKPNDILRLAATGIEDRAGHRDTAEGDKSMARNVAVFNALTGHSLTETDGWLFLACTKAARAVQGDFHEDDYVDLAGYVALAGESAAAADVPSGVSFSEVLKLIAYGGKARRSVWLDLPWTLLENDRRLIVVRMNDDPGTDRSPSRVELEAHDWFIQN